MTTSLLSSSFPTAEGGPVPVLEFRTLSEMLYRSASQYGERPLFGTKAAGGWRWTSYSDFARMVDEMRGGLASLLVGRGDRVAIIASNRLEWAVCAHACYGLGAAFVPMYESQTDKDWEYIVRDCGAKVLIVTGIGIRDRVEAFRDSLPQLSCIVALEGEADLSYRQVLERGRGRPVEAAEVDPGDIATIIYTSGTTGEPKGVLLTHANIVSNVSVIRVTFPIDRKHHSLSFLPWAHVFGQVGELHSLMSVGGGVAICESVEKLLSNLAETRPTILCAVPKIFNKIYAGVQKQISGKPPLIQRLFAAGMKASRKKRAGQRLSLGQRVTLWLANALIFSKIRKKFGGRLHFAFAGGAKLEKEVAEFIDDLGVNVYEGYGLSETSPLVSINTPSERKMGSVGKPIAGVRVSISPDSEVVVHGPNVMAGYHGKPDDTAAVMTADGGFRTGDMGRLDEDGFLYITGRIKEQYKLENGKYVAPSPLEEQLKLSPFIINVLVYGDNKPYNVALIVPDREALAAWVEKRGLTGNVDDEVRKLFAEEIQRCSSQFKNYERINNFALILEDFTQENDMLTPTMKLKRRNVLARWGEKIESLYR